MFSSEEVRSARLKPARRHWNFTSFQLSERVMEDNTYISQELLLLNSKVTWWRQKNVLNSISRVSISVTVKILKDSKWCMDKRSLKD